MKSFLKGKNVLQSACLMLAVFLLAGCATRIALEVQRLPTLDTAGIQRIAIMPFESTVRSTVYQNAASYVTNAVTSRIQATNRFTLVSPSTVNDARRNGTGIENFVDATFSGQITRIGENTATRQGTRRVRQGDEFVTVTYTYYVRTVEVDFNYQFVRARDGSLIGPITKTGSTFTSRENISDLPSVDVLVGRIVDNQLRNLHRDVAPYTIRVNRTLENDSRKELKAQMDSARALIRDGNYMAARQAYLAIWESHQSIAAAVNASILFEALGETQNGANLMQQVMASTGSPLARVALERLNRELAEQAGVEQFDGTLSPEERATAHAVAEIRRIIPAGTRLFIHNNATANQNIINNVIDNMTSEFLRLNITVIERQMIDLVLREQNFQLSGYVSDSDLVSIGNLAGANIIVIVDIAGTAAQRRLQVRVLDIRAGTIIMQSGTGTDWHL